MLSFTVLVPFCLFVCALPLGSGTLTTINGQLIRIVDSCSPGNDSTCTSGHCCVREGLAYIPEYTGLRPAFQIACRPYRQPGEFCYHPHVHTKTHEVCPCEPGLNCESSGIFGHCH